MNHVLFSNTLIVMNRRTSQRQPGKLTLFSLLAVISGGFPALSAPSCQRHHKNGLVEALRNLRQVKFALDGFATDFDGQFPNAATGNHLVEGGVGTASSNDYFRQLFMTEETESETIFWVKNSPVCRSAPDDKIEEGGKLQSALILEAGGLPLGLFAEARNTSPGNTPLLADPFAPGTTDWEADQGVIVLQIDGSAKALRAGDEVRCSPATRQHLVQPEPAS
jgi:hypothetical protein